MKLNIAENQDIEFKESWRDEYLKWICGFANAKGGIRAGRLPQSCIDDDILTTLHNLNLLSFIRYEGLQRIEDLEIPEDALREAIFNSIIHKNYAGVAIQMKIWSDRIELWNDGEFPFGFTEDDLKNGRKSKPRNKNIANAFYKAGFVESWGRGIKKICNKFSVAGLPEPVFENFCGGVNVTIPRNNPEVKEFSAEYLKAFGKGSQKIKKAENEGLNAQKLPRDCPEVAQSCPEVAAKTFDYIKQNPYATIKEISKALKISERTVKNHIALLRGTFIQRSGSDTKGHWIIK